MNENENEENDRPATSDQETEESQITESVPVLDPQDESQNDVVPQPGMVVLQPQAHRRQPQWGLVAAFVTLAALVIIFGIIALTTQQARIDALSKHNDGISVQVTELTEALQLSQENAQDLWDQLVALGEAPEGEDPETLPTPAPVTLEGDQGDRGEPGRPPSLTEIAQAVSTYCAINGFCRGSDGADVSDAQVAAAVTAFCSGARCVGDKGDTGEVGAVGPAGGVGGTGAKGDTGNVGDKGDKGDQGDPGLPGGPGEPGRGVASVTCEQPEPLGPTYLRFTYTDAAYSDVAASCTPVQVDEEETPTPSTE